MTTFGSPVIYVFLFGLPTAMPLQALAIYQRLRNQIAAWRLQRLAYR
jgi:hypothetical protein